MQRRSNGEGSIYRRKDGVWCGSVQVDGRRRTLYGKARKEVSLKLQALLQQMKASGRVCDSGKMTVEGFGREWPTGAAVRLRPTTLDAYTVIFEKFIIPGIGEQRLSRLDARKISAYYAHLAPNLSKRRLESIHGLLHKLLSDAQRWGLIPSNPAASVYAPLRDQKELHLWDPEQVRRFLPATQDGYAGMYSPLFGFILASGVRVGEALGLRWSDVDWESHVVRVERQITEVRGRPVELPPRRRVAPGLSPCRSGESGGYIGRRRLQQSCG